MLMLCVPYRELRTIDWVYVDDLNEIGSYAVVTQNIDHLSDSKPFEPLYGGLFL